MVPCPVKSASGCFVAPINQSFSYCIIHGLFTVHELRSSSLQPWAVGFFIRNTLVPVGGWTLIGPVILAISLAPALIGAWGLAFAWALRGFAKDMTR
jgi:hypothetical protein